MRRVAFFCCLLAMLVLDVHGQERQSNSVTVYVMPGVDLSGSRLVDSFAAQLRSLKNIVVLPTPEGAQFLIYVNATRDQLSRRKGKPSLVPDIPLDQILLGSASLTLGVTVVSRKSGKMVFHGLAQTRASGLLTPGKSADLSGGAAASVMKQLHKKLGWN